MLGGYRGRIAEKTIAPAQDGGNTKDHTMLTWPIREEVRSAVPLEPIDAAIEAQFQRPDRD